MLRTAAFSCAVMMVMAGAARADDDPPECLLTKSLPAHAPRFEQYPAGPAWTGTRAAPVLTTHLSRIFRTQLRTQSKEKPDFAGHYRIAAWGCGTRCIDWGLVDAKSGQVVMGDHYGDVDLIHVMDEPLMYRPDSRLFVILGAPNEKPAREGYTYLLWTGHAFRQIAFYPYKAYCRIQTQPVP